MDSVACVFDSVQTLHCEESINSVAPAEQDTSTRLSQIRILGDNYCKLFSYFALVHIHSLTLHPSAKGHSCNCTFMKINIKTRHTLKEGTTNFMPVQKLSSMSILNLQRKYHYKSTTSYKNIKQVEKGKDHE